MMTILKKTREKNTFEQDTKNEGLRCGTHNRARLQIKRALAEKTQILTMQTLNIKHYKKYKNVICKKDKNESLPQPIKSVSNSSYQLMEDYVTYCICSRSTSRC